MKVIETLSRWMGYLSSALVIILMLDVVADICGRYFFNAPILGASELATLMMAIIVFSALAWAALSEKHIKVDLVMQRFPPRVQAVVNSITLLLALGIFSVITWQSALEATEVHDVTSLLRVSHTPFYWIMMVGFGVFCISIIVLLIKNIAQVMKR